MIGADLNMSSNWEIRGITSGVDVEEQYSAPQNAINLCTCAKKTVEFVNKHNYLPFAKQKTAKLAAHNYFVKFR